MHNLRLDKKSALIVEDQAAMRASLKSMLDRLGARGIDPVSNGEDAIELLKSKQYDLVLCDYELGKGKDGQQVLEEARFSGLIRAKAVFILVTAAQTMEMVMGALEYHPDGYITKPITFDVLSARLTKIFKQKDYFAHINAAIDANQPAKALQECDLLIERNPKLALPTWRIKGKLLYNAGDTAAALAVYQQVQDSRQTPWAMLGLAKCYMQTGQDDKAEKLLKEMIAQNDKHMECYDLLAKIFERRGDTLAAQNILKQATELSPKAVLRQTELSRISTGNKDWEVSIKASRKAVFLGKNSCHKTPNNYLNLAQSLQHNLTKGSYRDKNLATTEITKTLDSIRQDYHLDARIQVKATLLEGVTFYNLDKKKEAELAIRAAREIFNTLPTEMDLTFSEDILISLEDIPDLKEAQVFSCHLKPLIEKAKAMEQQKAESERYNNQGIELFEQGQLKDAIEMFIKATIHEHVSESVLLNAIQALIAFMQKFGMDSKQMEICEQHLERLQSMPETDKRFARYQKLKDLYTQLTSGQAS